MQYVTRPFGNAAAAVLTSLYEFPLLGLNGVRVWVHGCQRVCMRAGVAISSSWQGQPRTFLDVETTGRLTTSCRILPLPHFLKYIAFNWDLAMTMIVMVVVTLQCPSTWLLRQVEVVVCVGLLHLQQHLVACVRVRVQIWNWKFESIILESAVRVGWSSLCLRSTRISAPLSPPARADLWPFFAFSGRAWTYLHKQPKLPRAPPTIGPRAVTLHALFGLMNDNQPRWRCNPTITISAHLMSHPRTKPLRTESSVRSKCLWTASLRTTLTWPCLALGGKRRQCACVSETDFVSGSW